jgi:outer membrane protein TolC
MTRAVLIAVAILAAAPLAAHAQTPVATGRLTVDAAIQLALAHNRQLQAARLQVQRADEDVAVARSRRLPIFESELTAAQLVSPVGFSFPRGAFGDFPATGPIPATDTTVTVPRRPTLSVTTQVSQPISELVQIGLGIKSAEATREIERARVRGHELAIVNATQRAYFAVLQTESALAAGDEAIALYRELTHTLEARVLQRVALRADALDVEYRLAQEELSQVKRRNLLASQKEQLNQLLGRDLRAPFETTAAAAAMAVEVDLDAAERRALSSRPDVREAQLTVAQAEIARRIARADRLPALSVAASYASHLNVDLLPRNLATVGLQVTWEPFDWGRQRRELASKTHAVAQARLNADDIADQVVLEVGSRYRTLTEARAALAVAERAQGLARERLRVVTNQFHQQSALLPDVLQRRADVASADDRFQQALLAFWTAKADFDQAVGEDVIP